MAGVLGADGIRSFMMIDRHRLISGERSVRTRNLFATLGALLFVWTAGAEATTYYVSPTGSAANAGTQSAPWSLAKANSSLLAGDVAILAPGTYVTSIGPLNSGTSYSRFIAYVGSLSNPATTVVPGITLGSRSYVSIKGVQFGGGLALSTSRDSIGWCIGPSGMVSFSQGGDDNVITNCTMTGGVLWVEGGTNSSNPITTNRDTLINSKFNINNSGYGACLRISATNGLYFKSCRFIIRNLPSGDHGLFKMYGGRYGKFIDCTFDMQNQRTTACDECDVSYFRDYTIYNLFQRDTFLLRGPNQCNIMLTGSGSFPGTSHGNRYDSCVFRQDAPSQVAIVYWQDGARSDTLTGCAMIGKGVSPIVFSGLSSNCLIKNNTFIRLDGGGFSAWASAAWSSWSSTSVINNIFYSTAASASGKSGSALSFDSPVGTNWKGNNNLYFCKNPASSSIYVDATGTGPGASGTLCKNYSADCSSIYGDPLLVGGSTSDVYGFDPHLRQNSPAIGNGIGGVDIGALPFGSSGSDVTPPATITDLAAALVNDDNVQLTWTAPGDDGMSGQASAYEIRMSVSPITALNFDSASPVANSLTPQPAGSREQFVVQGLTPGTQLFFAIKAIDNASNKSAISNVLSLTTSTTDVTPPAAIQDLSAQ